MTRYELLYIIPATHAETELQPVMDSVTSVLTKFGAKIARNDMVGKLKLAYPVDRIRHGYYVIVDMDIDPTKVSEIENALRLHSDVIRHQLMVKDLKAKPVFKLTSVEDIEREKSRGNVTREASNRQAAAAPKADKKVEVNMADLDQKLDKIVEGNII